MPLSRHGGPEARIAEIENVLRELGSIGPTCTNWLIAELHASSDREAAQEMEWLDAALTDLREPCTLDDVSKLRQRLTSRFHELKCAAVKTRRLASSGEERTDG